MSILRAHRELLDHIAIYSPWDSREAGMLERLRSFVESTGAAFDASHAAGHVTGSAWVLDPAGCSVLLTLHRKLGKWLQLGGHVEPEESAREAALREAREESGIESVVLAAQTIFDVDVHWIPDTPRKAGHWHYDVRYLFTAPAIEPAVCAESRAVAWVPLDRVGALNPDASLCRMAAKTRAGSSVSGNLL
jgi:8-oxo-dGTP pyrophosphatase MutT (NUDIX family)